MKIFTTILLVSLFQFTFCQNFVQAYQYRVNLVTSTNISSNLQEFVNFGVKTTGSTNNNNTFNWLKNKYISFGYTLNQIEEQTFPYSNTSSKNLIITKTGTLYPNIYVIVCGHYDTINGVGANDNGSGTVAILEIAKILQNIPTDYSIKFIHFSGEEQGLIGSQFYVNNSVNGTNPKMNIRLVFNLDQVGGLAGQNNNSIICERDMDNSPNTNNAASTISTQELMNCVSLYSNLTPILSYAYASDYIPFENNGEIITGFYEQFGTSNPNGHTLNDIITNMDLPYLTQVTKAALGATQHFAVASTLLSTDEIIKQNSNVKLVPNPAKDFFEILIDNQQVNEEISIEIFEMSGRKIQTYNTSKVRLNSISTGTYLVKVKTNNIDTSIPLIID